LANLNRFFCSFISF